MTSYKNIISYYNKIRNYFNVLNERIIQIITSFIIYIQESLFLSFEQKNLGINFY